VVVDVLAKVYDFDFAAGGIRSPLKTFKFISRKVIAGSIKLFPLCSYLQYTIETDCWQILLMRLVKKERSSL